MSTFDEVSLGFSPQQALAEAKRCLQCKNAPCAEGCPAGIDIKAFIGYIRNADYSKAINEIRKKNNLPGVCGRVCPQEEQCQLSCVLYKSGKPIKIGYLERFVADWGLNEKNKVDNPVVSKKNNRKIGVIGSGPAGLTCAGDLAKMGFDVYLFESLHNFGGVLRYGIPQFRLPNQLIEKEIKYIKSLGVKFVKDFVVGKTKTVDQLRREGFQAFFVASGAGSPKFLNIPGENLNDVYSANEFLARINLMCAYQFPAYHTPLRLGKRVGVIGAGNVSFDCARSALRMGAKEAYIIYRRGRQQMPAREEEVENAAREGVKFRLLTTPLKIVSNKDGRVTALVCVKNKLSDKDASGRRKPVAIEGSEFRIKLDTVIVAIGAQVNSLFYNTVQELEVDQRGRLIVNDWGQTSVPDIFAGGDVVSGSATVISAIHQAKIAAEGIRRYLDK